MPEDPPSFGDSLNWRPERPCRPEVAAVVRYVMDSLDAQGLLYETEQDDPFNPNCWLFVAKDEEDYATVGMIGWNEDRQQVGYAVLKPDRLAHDMAEGIGEDESKCFWSPTSAGMFVMALDGTVRDIVERERAKGLADMDAQMAAGEVEGLDIGDAPPVALDEDEMEGGPEGHKVA